MIYLPIIILGIERMIDENKSLLYIAFFHVIPNLD